MPGGTYGTLKRFFGETYLGVFLRVEQRYELLEKKCQREGLGKLMGVSQDTDCLMLAMHSDKVLA